MGSCFSKKLSIPPDTEIREMFDFFDADRDGKITFGELRTCLHTHGIPFSDIELRQQMEEVDRNRNGYVEFPEFKRAVIDKIIEENSEDDHIVHIFNLADADGSGTLSQQELRHFLIQFCGESITTDQIDALFSMIDEDDDGGIGVCEFREALQKLPNMLQKIRHSDKEK